MDDACVAGRARTRREVTHFCVYEVVWCPKYARPVLDGLETETKALLESLALETSAVVECCEVRPALVSLRMRVDPVVGLHKTVRHLKSRSDSVLRARWPALKTRFPTLWNSRYFVATISCAPDRRQLEAFLELQRHS